MPCERIWCPSRTSIYFTWDQNRTAEKLITEGRLDGAVVLGAEGVRVLLDSSSLQIAGAIQAAVQAGVSREQASQETIINIRYIFGYDLKMMDTVGPAILGLVVFFFTFINAAIAFIRERSQGTLEKFMVSPLSRVEMVSGYVLGFSLFTILQSATTLFVVTALFGVPLRSSALTVLAVVLLLGAGALVLGSFFSNFARSEFQVVQFITPHHHASDCALWHLVALAICARVHPGHNITA